jgi:hypothetical protein
VTTITASKLAQPSPEQIERATAIAAKLLAGHDDRTDRKPRTASAFGRALTLTPPGSDHGKLLAAALRPARWADRTREQCVVLQLARRGETPTAGAVAARLDQLEAHRAHVDRLRAQAAPLGAADGPRAAAHVAQVVRATAEGPTWWELGDAMGWPRNKFVREFVIRGLAAAGWLRVGPEPRSLRPGPKAMETGAQ